MLSSVLTMCAVICVARKRTVLSFVVRSGRSVFRICDTSRDEGVSGKLSVASPSAGAATALSI